MIDPIHRHALAGSLDWTFLSPAIWEVWIFSVGSLNSEDVQVLDHDALKNVPLSLHREPGHQKAEESQCNGLAPHPVGHAAAVHNPLDQQKSVKLIHDW